MAINAPAPWPPCGLVTIGAAPAFGAAVSLDSTTGKDLAFIWQAPQADTILGFKFKLSGVTGSPGVLRASAQGVSASNGLNTGTILGATNTAKKDWSPVSGEIGVYYAAFEESFAVAAGDQVAFALKPQSGTWDASNLVQAIYRLTNVESEFNPYAVNNAARATNGLQQIIVVGANRSYECCLLSTGNSGNLQSGGTPNEVGSYFLAPSDCSALDCVGVQIGGSVTAGRSFNICLRSGTTLLASKSIDTDTIATGVARLSLYFGAVPLTPGAAYHVSVLSTHASGSVTIYQHSWGSSADRLAYLAGTTVYHAERAGGSWTYDQAKLSCVLPILANRAVVSAGGGPLVGGRLIG